MPIKSLWRRTSAAGLATTLGIAIPLVTGLTLAAPGEGAATENAPNPQPFDRVAQSSPATTSPGSSTASDPFDIPAPSATQPQPSTAPATQPTPSRPTTPDLSVPQTEPAPGARTPAPPGSLPENPFGEATPAPTTGGTTPPSVPDTMPGPSQPGTGQSPPANIPPQGEAPQQSDVQQEVKAATDLISQGKYEEALAHLDEAAKASPNESAVYFYQGVAYRMLNRFDNAIDAFTKAIQIANQNNTLDPEAYLRRGVVWFYKGEYGVAWQDFDEASAILYDDPRPEVWKGLARAKQENWLDAITSYAVALQHDDKFAPAWVNLGLGYLALNQPNKAVYCLDQAVRLEPRNASSYFKRGIALSRLGKFREAADSYSEAIRIQPDYAAAWYNRSLVNRDLGNAQQAAKDRAKALRLNPQIERQLISAG